MDIRTRLESNSRSVYRKTVAFLPLSFKSVGSTMSLISQPMQASLPTLCPITDAVAALADIGGVEERGCNFYTP